MPPPPPEASLSFASTTVAANATIGVGASSINTTPQIITVHVAGAVKNPGVYRLKYGSRINDGLFAAGGATSAANLDVINLATVLNEGEQIYVPKRGEKFTLSGLDFVVLHTRGGAVRWFKVSPTNKHK